MESVTESRITTPSKRVCRGGPRRRRDLVLLGLKVEARLTNVLLAPALVSFFDLLIGQFLAPRHVGLVKQGEGISKYNNLHAFLSEDQCALGQTIPRAVCVGIRLSGI